MAAAAAHIAATELERAIAHEDENVADEIEVRATTGAGSHTAQHFICLEDGSTRESDAACGLVRAGRWGRQLLLLLLLLLLLELLSRRQSQALAVRGHRGRDTVGMVALLRRRRRRRHRRCRRISGE